MQFICVESPISLHGLPFGNPKFDFAIEICLLPIKFIFHVFLIDHTILFCKCYRSINKCFWFFISPFTIFKHDVIPLVSFNHIIIWWHTWHLLASWFDCSQPIANDYIAHKFGGLKGFTKLWWSSSMYCCVFFSYTIRRMLMVEIPHQLVLWAS